MLGQSNFIKVVLAISIVAIILFPLYAIFIQHPAFTKLLTENTTREAERIASILSSMLITGQQDLTKEEFAKDFPLHVQDLLKDSRILKLKIFSPSGRIVYSTDAQEIGHINEEDYFHQLVQTGDRRTQQVDKNTASLEHQIIHADVVETYVPIVKSGRMIGVFEIYYDISTEKQKLRDLITVSTGTLYLFAVILLVAVIVSVIKTAAVIRENQRIEDALVESEKRYRTLFENAADAIIIMEAEGDEAGMIVAANRAVSVMHGYTAEELKIMKVTDLDTAEAAREAPNLIRRILNGEWIKTDMMHKKKDGTVFPVEVSAGLLELGSRKYVIAFDRDITVRRQIETGREKLIKELKEAVEKIRTLRGLLPICASCKKIRDDKGYWNQIESYVRDHTEAEFTHGICPDCARRLYPEIDYDKMEQDPHS